MKNPCSEITVSKSRGSGATGNVHAVFDIETSKIRFLDNQPNWMTWQYTKRLKIMKSSKVSSTLADMINEM